MQENSLTRGPVRKTLISFSIPIILSMFAAQFYSIIDSVIIGWQLDADALAAVSNAGTIVMVFLFISGGMELGGNLLVAAKKPLLTKERMGELVYNLLFIDLILAVLMVLFGVICFRYLLVLINTPAEIMKAAMIYGILYLTGLPFQMIYDLIREILIGCGDSKTPLYTVILTSVVNIVLDIAFIPFMGVEGAAIATVAAQIIGCAIVIYILRRQILAERFRMDMLSMGCLKDILRLAPPNMLQQMSTTVVLMIKQGLLGTLGVAAIAGFSCAGKITNLMMLVVFGSVQALTTYIAQNLAVGEQERIKEGLRAACRILLLITTIIILVCVLFHNGLMRLFTDDADTIRYGSIILIYEPMAYYFTVIRLIQDAKFRGHQKMLYYLISSISYMVLNVLSAAVLVPRIGYSGFYIGTYIGSVCGLGISLFLAGKLSGLPEKHPF